MSAATREVRDDQHGTTTGYSYGCRCIECCDARRTYAKGYDRRAGSDVAARVLAAIEHEADLDGVATATFERLGELGGVAYTSVKVAVHQLADEGRIEIVGRFPVRGGVLEIRLPEVAS